MYCFPPIFDWSENASTFDFPRTISSVWLCVFSSFPRVGSGQVSPINPCPAGQLSWVISFSGFWSPPCPSVRSSCAPNRCLGRPCRRVSVSARSWSSPSSRLSRPPSATPLRLGTSKERRQPPHPKRSKSSRLFSKTFF